MLLTCGFSSTLISCLARKESVIPLANLEDVATKRTHSLCVRNESNAYLHFTVGIKNRNNGKYKYNMKLFAQHLCVSVCLRIKI